MNANELYKIWAKFSGNVAEVLPMKSATDKIYYFTYKSVKIINLTINLKDKKFLETE